MQWDFVGLQLVELLTFITMDSFQHKEKNDLAVHIYKQS